MKSFLQRFIVHSAIVLPCVDFVTRLLDILLIPLVLLSSATLYFIRRLSLERRGWKMPVSRTAFQWIGVFPIVRHYYEPFPLSLAPVASSRLLSGIDLNVEGQLDYLKKLRGVNELAVFPRYGNNSTEHSFHHVNYSFQFVDAEYLYLMIRTAKPQRIVEIGSGYSTLMMLAAVRANSIEGTDCTVTCIEPFENPWLERTGATIVRSKVEAVGLAPFGALERNDILFIDSSHVIRPGGDVLAECLTILPALKPGVLVHFHDIYTPDDYPDYIQKDRVLLWNEQYLLEAFLSHNRSFSIIGALNYLKTRHGASLAEVCPSLRDLPNCVPGSFWLEKTG